MASLARGMRLLAAQGDFDALARVAVGLAIEAAGAATGRFVAPDAIAAWKDAPDCVARACRERQLAVADGAACLPLVHGQALLGLIFLEGLGAAGPDTAALDILAGHAAAVLDNLALREHVRRDGALQRQAEVELEFKQNLLRTVVEHLPFRIYAKDRDSRFLFGNALMARLAGVATPAALSGKTDYDFFPAELAAKYFADEQQVLASGQALLDYEELVEDQDTGELGWTVTTKVLLRDSDGQVSGIVGIGYDVTQRKRMEASLRERTQALEIANATLVQEKAHQQVLIRKLGDMQGQLLQSEKMASIGLLAAGVAHEINNPIAFISSNFSALERDAQQILQLVGAYESVEAVLPLEARTPITRMKRDIGLDDIRLDLDALLSESLDGLKRVKQIVQNLKDFSRVGGVEAEMANLEQGLDSTLNVAWNELKYKAEVVRQYGGIPDVRCLPSQINQVFLNLLINAADAIVDEGRIVVRTGHDAEHVWVEIADNGAGIAPEHMDHIFEPFYTTKPIGKGTGLGLSIVYGIVQGHGGRIEVDSAPGRGTAFKVILPRAWHAGARDEAQP